MARATKASSSRNDVDRHQPASYDLSFVGGFQSLRPAGGRLEAELGSQSLDRAIHPRGTVPLLIDARPVVGKGAGTGFLVDSFQLDSVAEFLRGQAAIRRALEKELNELRAGSGGSGKGGGTDVWRHVKVLTVRFPPRYVLSPEQREQLRKRRPDLTDEDLRIEVDQPDTASRFSISLRLGWDEEHL